MTVPTFMSTSKPNVDVARALYRAFTRADIGAVTALLDPQFVMETPAGTPEQGSYVGAESAARHLRGIMEPFHEVRVEPEEFLEVDDRHVVVTVHVSGTGKASGLSIDTRFAHVLTIRTGKVVRLQAFLSKEEALQAAPGRTRPDS